MKQKILLALAALLLIGNISIAQDIQYFKSGKKYGLKNMKTGKLVINASYDACCDGICYDNGHYYYFLQKGTTLYLFSDEHINKPIKTIEDIVVSRGDKYIMYNGWKYYLIKRGNITEIWSVNGDFIIDAINAMVTMKNSSITLKFYNPPEIFETDAERLEKQSLVLRHDKMRENKWGLWDNKKHDWVNSNRYQKRWWGGKSYNEPHSFYGVSFFFFYEKGKYYFIPIDDCNTSLCDLSEYSDILKDRDSFRETGAFAAVKGGKYGMIDFKGNTVVDFIYSDIRFPDGRNEVHLFKKGSRYEKITYDLLASRVIENLKKSNAEKQKNVEKKKENLSSFTRYATAYVKPRMAEWQQKGEFEKVADYTKRVSGENRQRKIDELTREAENNFIRENTEMVNLRSTISLETYDSENEVFSLNSTKFGRLLIPVPISNGPAFKQAFGSATISNEKYFVDNDRLAIASFDIMVGGRSYHYSNNNSLNYSQFQLNPDALDLPAINIVTGNSTASMRKPKVIILSPQSGSQYDNGTVSFRINIVPGDGQQPVLYVEINGAEAIELQPVNQQSKGARAVEGKLYEINLPTTPGTPCYLTFSARDEQNISSEPQRVKLIYTGQIVKPKLILFAVGVGDYPAASDLTKLRFSAKDASDFTRTVENANLEDYTSLLKHVYIDNDATRKNLNSGLRQLLNEASQGDVVMFYFSGHGVQDGSETYFMTIDASQDAPSDGISFADLKNNMRKLTDRQVKVVAFMDACHAGAMVGAKGAAPKLTELNVENVIEFYSSTQGEESAEDEKLQNGVFTAALVSGLNGAAANKDGYITVNTLRTYITDYVREHNKKQTPMFKGVDAGDITLFHKK